MTAPVLVTGGSGRLGRVVVRGLRRQGANVRVLTRQPQVPADDSGVQHVRGDFDDPATLAAALQGVARVFLLSPISPRLGAQQTALVHAAQAAGVQRIVKLSGSDWTLWPPGRSVSGDQHRQVEGALAASGLPVVLLRPNAWMQVALGGLPAEVRQGTIRHAHGDAAVAWIDLRDIADVAVKLLLADSVPAAPLVLTGPESLTAAQVADLARRISGQPVQLQALTPEEVRQRAIAHKLPPFVQQAHAEFGALIRSGAAAGVSTTVADVLGRPARTLEAWLGEQLSA